MNKLCKQWLQMVISITAVMTIAFSSCVNPEYDITMDIEGDATLFENISLPIGNVEKITIDEILFTDGSSIQNLYSDASGDYFLDFTSGSFDTDIEIPSFSLDGIRMEDQTIIFDIPDQYAGMSTDFLDITLKYSDLFGPLSYDMLIEVDNELPTEIKDIKEAYMNATLKCNFEVNEGTMYIKEGFSLEFPEFMYLAKDCESADYRVTDEHHVMFTGDAEINVNNPLSLNLSFSRIDLPEDCITVDRYGRKRITINDVISVDGDFYIKTKDFNKVPQSIDIVMHISIEDLEVSHAKVSLDTSFDIPDEDFHVSGIPEFFTGSNVKIDLYNPYLYISLENNSPFAYMLDADFTAYSSNGRNDIHLGSYNEMNANSIHIPAYSAKDFYISRRQLESSPSGASNIVIPDLGNLIMDIPERVSIHDIIVTPDEELVMIDAGSIYNASIDYRLTSPLSFGDKLDIMFEQEITGLGLQFDADVRSAVITMDMVNSIPVDFELTAVCLDDNGNELSQTTVELDKTIAAGTHQQPATTPLLLTIKNTYGTFNVDALKLMMRAKGNPAYSGKSLNRNQGFEIKNIVLTLPDGIGVEIF